MKKWIRLILLLFLVMSAGSINSSNFYAEAETAITFDNLDPINTSLVAFKKVNGYIDSKAVSKTEPVLHLSPNMGSRDYGSYLFAKDRITRLWSEFIAPEKLNVVLFTENDPEWVDKKQMELSGEWQLDNELQSVRLKKYGCNIGGMYLPGILYFCVKNEKWHIGEPSFYPQAHLFAHEYTHFMEMHVKNWMGSVKGQSIGKRNACWIEEGFATFYGFAVGSYLTEPSGRDHRKFLKELTFEYDKRRNQSPGTLAKLITEGNVAETKRLFGMLENTPWPCEETQNAYALGSLAAEALVAVKGQEGMVNFYKSSARTGDWRISFQEAFGIPVDTFYEKLTPYLASQFNETSFKYATSEPTSSAGTPSPISSQTPTPTATPIPASTPLPSPTASAKSTTKKLTITCVKGKVTKKVTAIKPKCPAGFKKR